MGDMAAGSVFAGHRIEAVAGRGGMGVVYKARQLSLDRTVALKVIAPALTQDPAIRRRFLRESRIAASIDHPNVIPIYYTGEEGETAYIAMRYVAGDDLRTLVRRESRLRPAHAARIVAQVGAALDAAHAAGLVHRDVKPANVLLGPDEHAYLTDFGLTKHVMSEPGPTRSGHWVGTLDFVAPEQIRGERVDARADVYGLGCLLHYALTGRAPFARDTDEAKLWAHLSEPPPLPSEAAPEVPPELDAVVARALAKSPDERFPSAGDLGRAAVAAAGGAGVAGRERMVAVGAAAPVEVETRTAALPAEPPAPRRRRALLAAVIAAAFVAAATVAFLVLRDDGREPAGGVSASAAGSSRSASAAGSTPSPRPVGGSGPAPSCTGTSTPSTPSRCAVSRALGPEVGIGLNGLASSRGHAVGRHRRATAGWSGSGRATGGSAARAIPLPAAANAIAADPDSVWVVVRHRRAGHGRSAALRRGHRQAAADDPGHVGRPAHGCAPTGRCGCWPAIPRAWSGST